MRIGAVILAAGAGTRMGGVAKAVLKRASGLRPQASGRTFLEAVVETAREAGASDVVVVVGPPFGETVAVEAERLGARVVWNREPERGMASSIAEGFGALGEVDAAWLWPVDHPDVTVEALRTLIDSLGGHDCARPVYAGRRGHPPLVARALWPALCEGRPARDVIAAADTIDVPVDDAGCVRDIDTLEDLA